MKKMQKAVCLGLGLTMAFSLAGCGSSASKPGVAATSTDLTAITDVPASSSDLSNQSDLVYVRAKRSLVIGVTNTAPLDYREEGDFTNWYGFDADMARAFAESLGVEAEFLEIIWDNRVMDLQSKEIDCMWNGMTLTEDAQSMMACSEPYFSSAQVVVVPSAAADRYQSADSLTGLNFAAEKSSAGAEALDGLNLPYTAVDSRVEALEAVAEGVADACVVDLAVAEALTGAGNSYPDLRYTVRLSSGEYCVGFRPDSDLAAAFNSFWKEAYDAGTVQNTAQQYGLEAYILEK